MHIYILDTRSKSKATEKSASEDVASRKKDEDEDEDEEEDEDFEIEESEEEEEDNLDGFVVEDDIPGVKERETVGNLKQPEEEEQQESVDFLIGGMQQMSVATENPSYSIGFVNPFIQYGYTKNKQRFIQIDVLVMTLPKDMFRPEMCKSGKQAKLSIVCPQMLFNKKRLMSDKAEDLEFSQNCHQATSFEEISNSLQDDYNRPKELLGEPQIFPLLFKCETVIVEWKVNYYAAGSKKLDKDLKKNKQYLSIVSIKLKSVEKAHEDRKKGRTSVNTKNHFGIDSSDSEDDDNENYYDQDEE